jgi:hypothetical protein
MKKCTELMFDRCSLLPHHDGSNVRILVAGGSICVRAFSVEFCLDLVDFVAHYRITLQMNLK